MNNFYKFRESISSQGLVTITPYALITSFLLGFIDHGMPGGEGKLGIFLSIRLLSCLPLVIQAIRIKKGKKVSSVEAAMSCFIPLAIGVSSSSYLLFGLESSYYFGLICILFLQVSFVPISTRVSIVSDLILYSIYFIPNAYFIETSGQLFIQQTSNFIIFAFFKVFAIRNLNTLMLNNFKSIKMKSELQSTKEVQLILGELCHLINNPLFISISGSKKIRKLFTQNDLDDSQFNAVLMNLERINSVLKIIHDMQLKNDISTNVIKKILKEEDSDRRYELLNDLCIKES